MCIRDSYSIPLPLCKHQGPSLHLRAGLQSTQYPLLLEAHYTKALTLLKAHYIMALTLLEAHYIMALSHHPLHRCTLPTGTLQPPIPRGPNPNANFRLAMPPLMPLRLDRGMYGDGA